MKKLLTLSTTAVLILSLGAVALAANTSSQVNNTKINAKQPAVSSVQAVALQDNTIKQINNSNVSSAKVDTNNYTKMIELEKLRLQQAIDKGVITQQQTNYWKSQIQQMEDNYNKNGTVTIPRYNQGISADRFKQMIETEKNRLQQAVDKGIINKTQEDFWRSQIDIMENNYKNNNFNMGNICLSFYDEEIGWNKNYGYNKNNQTTSNVVNSNTTQQSTYNIPMTASDAQKTGTTKTSSRVNNNAFNQRMQGKNMDYNNFNNCSSDNWNNGRR